MLSVRNVLGVLALGYTLAAVSPAAATEIGDISSEEYYAATYYQQALEDPRIMKIKSERKRMAKIARSIRIKPKVLKAAIEKMDGLPGKASELAIKAIKGSFADTRVKGRVLDVLINDSEPKHVVAYVRFRGSKGKDVIKDASTIANVVATKAPLVSTISLSAIHPKAPATSKRSVWGAKIGADRAAGINPKRIEDYAERLYKRLFEVVESKPF